MAEYRSRTYNSREENVSQELTAEEGTELTPVPPQISASYVEQTERPLPVAKVTQQLALQQQTPLQQIPQQQTPLQQIWHGPPPPYYPTLEQPPNVTKRNNFKVQWQPGYNICTVWKGILEIAVRIGVIVSVHLNHSRPCVQ